MKNSNMLFRQCETVFFGNIITATIINIIPCQFTKENYDELLVLKVDDETTILRRLAEVELYV